MSIKNIFTVLSILFIFAFVLVIYPSMNQSARAEQTKFKGASNLTKIFRINIESTAMLIHYFGKAPVDKALMQPGCVIVHVYYGKNKDGKAGYLFFGVDKTGNETLASIVPNCGIKGCP
jgi:hypothetical protein